MTELTTDQPDTAMAAPQDGVLPVLITFVLLFLLSAAVWFILDRIRAEEVRSTDLAQPSERHAPQPAMRAQSSKVAAK